jgi:hypothetical protein
MWKAGIRAYTLAYVRFAGWKNNSVRSPANVRSGAGTIRKPQHETPKKVKNTNTPKTMSKSERCRNEAIDEMKGKEGRMILKTLGAAVVSRWVGRMGQRGGLFLFLMGEKGWSGDCLSRIGMKMKTHSS